MATHVVYKGPYEEVELPLPDGSVEVVKNGGEVEIEDHDFAENLLKQDIWVRPRQSSASKQKKED